MVHRVVKVHRVCATGHGDCAGSRRGRKAVQGRQARVWTEEQSRARGRVIRGPRRRFVVVRAPQKSFTAVHGRSERVVAVVVGVLVVLPEDVKQSHSEG